MLDWSGYNERLVRRGEILLDLEFLKDMGREIEDIERGKAGQTVHLWGLTVHITALFLCIYPQLQDHRGAVQGLPKARAWLSHAGSLNDTQEIERGVGEQQSERKNADCGFDGIQAGQSNGIR